MEFVIDARLQNKLARIGIFWDKKDVMGVRYSSSGTVWCPCCNYKLRSGPRESQYKMKYLVQKVKQKPLKNSIV